jgi:hypothetical protein
MEKQNIYQFKVEDLSGNTFDFSLKRKKIMCKTASKCGLTPQYKGRIYKEYKDQNFVIIGFPANNFGSKNRELMKRLLLPTKLQGSFDGQSIRKGGDILLIISILDPKNLKMD